MQSAVLPEKTWWAMRDPVAGDEEADHDLGAVPAVVAGVAEGLGGKARIR